MSKRVAAGRREGFFKSLVEGHQRRRMTVWWREGWRLGKSWRREFFGWRGGRGRLVAAALSLHCYTTTISGENGVFGAVGRVQARAGYLGQGG